ncbi:hypothetical protein EVAR_96215_1 [Eumeta japonica]|uniref:Uncharacterized protein n=1 Tax=Eumeta variegata TaxID=151549 RepID=A0A4C1WMU0_EUMVA|nr:hypothetical protein EVAR_96215_1 [Eumeta japonica]
MGPELLAYLRMLINSNTHRSSLEGLKFNSPNLQQRDCESPRLSGEVTFHDESPFLATVSNRFNEFKRGRTNLTDDLREGRPSRATTE